MSTQVPGETDDDEITQPIPSHRWRVQATPYRSVYSELRDGAYAVGYVDGLQRRQSTTVEGRHPV